MTGFGALLYFKYIDIEKYQQGKRFHQDNHCTCKRIHLQEGDFNIDKERLHGVSAKSTAPAQKMVTSTNANLEVFKQGKLVAQMT